MTVTQSLFSGTFRLLVWFQYPKELLSISLNYVILNHDLQSGLKKMQSQRAKK